MGWIDGDLVSNFFDLTVIVSAPTRVSTHVGGQIGLSAMVMDGFTLGSDEFPPDNDPVG